MIRVNNKFCLIFFILVLIFNYLINYVLFFRKENCSLVGKKNNLNDQDIPILFLITPTYYRPEQLADLTRLSQTLLLVKNIYWILIEDSNFKTKNINLFLQEFHEKLKQFKNNLKIHHLNIATPEQFKIKKYHPQWSKAKGVYQRNLALDYLTENYGKNNLNAVLYFMDDDNSYDLRIFEEMRTTEKVSIWPVGLAGQLLVEKPILNNRNQVIKFNSIWKPERKYPIDMAAFAINFKFYISKKSPKFTYNVPIGYQETYILNKLIKNQREFEPKSENCKKVLVWHTKTVKFYTKKKQLSY